MLGTFSSSIYIPPNGTRIINPERRTVTREKYHATIFPVMGKNHIERLLYIDHLIRSDRYPSRNDIAVHFEVSIKTVERDLEYMKYRLNAPLEYDRFKKGYYYSEEGFYLPAVFMGEGEALALLSAKHFGRLWRDTPLADLAENAWESLRYLMPREISIHAEAFSDRITVIDRSVNVQPDIWQSLIRAASSQLKTQISYRSPGQNRSITRLIHPYQLIFHRDAWYLFTFDETPNDYRRYALSRIREVVITKEQFTIPNDFSLDNYIDPEFGIYKGGDSFDVVLEADSRAADVMMEHLPYTNVFVTALESDKKEIRFTSNQEEELLHWVLAWGSHVKVKQPESLRQRLREIGEFYTNRY